VTSQVDFGNVSVGDVVEKDIVLCAPGEESFEVKAVLANSRYIVDCSWGPCLDSRFEGNPECFRVHVKLNTKDIPLGGFESELFIETSLLDKPEFRIPVSARLVPDLAVSPSRVCWGFIHKGKDYETDLVIRSLSGRPFALSHLDSDLRNLQITPVTFTNQDVHVIKIKYRCLDDDDIATLDGTVTIESDIADQPALTIPVFAVNAEP